MAEPPPIIEYELPAFNVEHDVLVLPEDFDKTTLSSKSKITLELLDEMGKVIYINSLSRPAVIKVR